MFEKDQSVRDLLSRLLTIKAKFDVSGSKVRLRELESESMDPNLWDNQERARTLMQDIDVLKSDLSELEKLEGDLLVLESFAKENILPDGFGKDLVSIEKRILQFEIKSFLSGEYDKKNAMISIHAGQGGVEAMDWTGMLYRMYVRYGERMNFKVESIDISQGEESGYKSITFKVSGEYAYGYLKKEAGTHRLVRQSPFNADNLRQTSFALVEVLPELNKEDLPTIEIKDEDLEWQFYRSSSQGGQNVQKVSTAVRLKHKPTEIVVTAQTERFQEQNRKIALSLLRAKLWVREKNMRDNKVKSLKGEYRPPSWGNQIRSYVLHPYKMVKDLRTNAETSDAESVLDGDLGMFIEAEMFSDQKNIE